MNEVKRFDGFGIVDEEGCFVRHKDYAALQKQNESNEALLYAMRQDMRESRKKMGAMLGENVALKQAIDTHKHGFVRCECCGEENMCHNDDVCRVLGETPATDTIANELRAEGIHYLSSEAGEMAQKFKQGSSDWRRWKSIVFFAETVETQLRAGNVEGGE
ncbi:hypothetical protein [Pantoea sp.]|uniref:hypothetical protein n=1 Tax=Pantoea sp. TaxID=69393 RepID=UPI0031D721B1